MGALLSEAELDRLEGVDRLHLVFKTHFDLGFTDLAARVRDRYVDDFLPRAIDLARRSREEGARRFVWTVGSWLVYESLEQGSPTLRKRLEQAIAHGDITWTAAPFTPHSELMGRDLFALGLTLSQRLDARFGTRTLAANFTDVPGHSIGIVPLLAHAGVRFLHVGVNPASALPAVPLSFRWRAPVEEAEIAVSYNDDYGGVTRLGSSPQALLIVFTDDNVGPPEPAEVERVYSQLESHLPEVQIDATGMNAFADLITPANAELPVVDRELGDSWIHGGATDPAKLTAYRELVRLRREWLASGTATEDELENAYRVLMLVAEHTWGLDVKSHCGDESTWGKPEFLQAAPSDQFAALASSWSEQRDYVKCAVDLLPDRLATLARDRLAPPAAPDREFPSEAVEPGVVFANARLELSIDHVSGAVSHLVDRETGDVYVAPDSPFPLATYQTFDAADYERFHREYLRSDDPWAFKDFGKPGLEHLAGAVSGSWTPERAAVRSARVGDAILIRCEVSLPPVCAVDFGAPRRLVYEFALRDEMPRLELRVSWSEKDPVRLPEALWLTFRLANAQASGWLLDKLGVPVSALDVVDNGGQLHAVERGVTYADQRRALAIELLDTPVVSALGPRLLRFDARRPHDTDGISACLFNNVWGTNFPQWYGEGGSARFIFSIGGDARTDW